MKKYLEERRQRDRELAEREAKARCAICKQKLPAPALERFGDERKFCSADCLADAEEGR